jgi:phage-related minor tail protein
MRWRASSSPNAAAGGLGASLGSVPATALRGLFGGARADGGPVSASGAYLVGERGPEVFRPTSGGEIGSASSGGLSINLTVYGAADPQRSEAQIAQALARAARLGVR